MSEFKVGDKVRCRSLCSSEYNVEGIIVTIDNDREYVKPITVRPNNKKGYALYFDFYELELSERREVPFLREYPAPPFNDRIFYLKGSYEEPETFTKPIKNNINLNANRKQNFTKRNKEKKGIL